MNITFYNDNADERYRGHTFDMFPVRFDTESNSWVECTLEESSHFGILAPSGEISPFFYDPSDFGIVTEGDVKLD